MRKLSELQQEIESVRFELDQALLRQDKFDNYYQKSTKLDQLIEEYIEETERSKQRRMDNNPKNRLPDKMQCISSGSLYEKFYRAKLKLN